MSSYSRWLDEYDDSAECFRTTVKTPLQIRKPITTPLIKKSSHAQCLYHQRAAQEMIQTGIGTSTIEYKFNNIPSENSRVTLKMRLKR